MPDAHNDDLAYGILDVISARASDDGTHIILELKTAGDNLPIAIPVGVLPPILALLGQASLEAHAIAGSVAHQRILESSGTEVFRDERNVDIHFRLSRGLDLPIGLTVVGAAALRDQLSASLAGAISSPSGATRQ